MRIATDRNTTITTTLPAVNCTWDVTFNRTDAVGVRTVRITDAAVDEAFRFSTCSTEPAGGQSCVSQGFANGAWVMSNRAGAIVADGSCCSATEFNRVVNQTVHGCNGYLNQWQQSSDRYFSVDDTIAGQRYSTIDAAKQHCLSLGTLCWGLMDDGCDGSGFLLVDGFEVNSGNWEGRALSSSQGTCLYQKQAASDGTQTAGSSS